MMLIKTQKFVVYTYRAIENFSSLYEFGCQILQEKNVLNKCEMTSMALDSWQNGGRKLSIYCDTAVEKPYLLDVPKRENLQPKYEDGKGRKASQVRNHPNSKMKLFSTSFSGFRPFMEFYMQRVWPLS